jgi:hypothetical protein
MLIGVYVRFRCSSICVCFDRANQREVSNGVSEWLLVLPANTLLCIILGDDHNKPSNVCVRFSTQEHLRDLFAARRGCVFTSGFGPEDGKDLF